MLECEIACIQNRCDKITLPCLLIVLIAASVVPSLSCSRPDPEDGGKVGPTVCLFDLEGEGFFDAPFPSEVRRTHTGRIDLSGFPNPKRSRWVEKLIQATQEDVDGFGLNSAIYFRFSAPINEATLPAGPSLSRLPSSSVLLVNIDEESPRFGEMLPFYTFFRKEIGFAWQPNMLVILPAQGFALEPRTLYCAVVTTRVEDRAGKSVTADEDFEALVDDFPGGPAGRFSQLEELHRKALAVLEGLGVDPGSVVNMALFRTMDPVGEMKLVAETIYNSVPEPVIEELALTEEAEDYYLFEGRYLGNPIFQFGWSEGLFPYETEGGHFVFDENGHPVINGYETMAVALSVPKSPMPIPAGYPVLLYAHGTGGNYKSFVMDGTAARMARHGVAAVGIDNAMNGSRIPEGRDPVALFFNITNVRAGRDNNRQAAADLIQLERLAVSLVIPAEESPTGEEIRLDGSRIMFMGHSQGGLNGSLYLALSKRCRGGYLSGAAGNLLYSIVYKTSPANLLILMALFNGLSVEEMRENDFGLYHPFLTLMQMFIEPADPINYARYWFADPFDGMRPRHILQIEGLGDTYSPPQGMEALGVAADLDLVEPVLQEVEGFHLQGKVPLERPVRGNVLTPWGAVTAGFAQYLPPPGEDGHFVSFDNPEAIATWTWFLATLANSNLPEIR